MRKAGELLKGRYLIERELGRGGVGVVYLARDQKLFAKPVVVKMLLEEQEEGEHQQWFRRHFRDEVEALARINHAGVVSVLDTDETPEGLPYMVMEYVAGAALRAVMSAEGIALARAGLFIRQIGRALAAAHENGVIHRDLKPENIMLQTASGNEETLKLIDFGIATVKKRLDDETLVKTAIAGTINYMAPEQLRGNPTSASDTYALGVIAYELVTGRLPFNPHGPYELLELQRAGVQTPPMVWRPDLPHAAQSLILQALAFDPVARPRSPREFGEQLAQALSASETSGDQLQDGVVLAGRYRIVRRLGGSVSSVYLAEDLRQAGRQVVVKELSERVADETMRQEVRAAFQRETGQLARLTHAALPRVYDYFQQAARYYLVTEFVVGVNLAAHMRAAGGPLAEATVTQWASEICAALEYLHALTPPVVYRDLSPTNVMIEAATNRIKLTDYGLARVVAPVAKGMTALATLGYAAPEAIRGKAEPRSDLYSLGALMFYLLTGCDPSDTPLMVFDFSKNPTPRQLAPKLSAELEQVIFQAVKFKAEDRVASAQALSQLLREHLARWRFSAATTLVTEEPVAELRCRHCGHVGGAAALFCGGCGRRLRQSAKLTALSSAGAPSEWALEGAGEIVLGRADPQKGITPQVDLTKLDPTSSVSRTHACIRWRDGRFYLEDLGSANGTFLNHTPRLAKGEPQALAHGAELKLGDVRLKFVLLD